MHSTELTCTTSDMPFSLLNKFERLTAVSYYYILIQFQFHPHSSFRHKTLCKPVSIKIIHLSLMISNKFYHSSRLSFSSLSVSLSMYSINPATPIPTISKALSSPFQKNAWTLHSRVRVSSYLKKGLEPFSFISLRRFLRRCSPARSCSRYREPLYWEPCNCEQFKKQYPEGKRANGCYRGERTSWRSLIRTVYATWRPSGRQFSRKRRTFGFLSISFVRKLNKRERTYPFFLSAIISYKRRILVSRARFSWDLIYRLFLIFVWLK